MMGCVGGLREIRSSQYAGRRTAISGNFTESKWLSELANPESEFAFAAKSWNPNPQHQISPSDSSVLIDVYPKKSRPDLSPGGLGMILNQVI
jgi:hypothetical protein